MELRTLLLVLSSMTSVLCKDCQPSADDLVDVLETEVDSYDQFIYGRYLESETVTCQRVFSGMQHFRNSFFDEMAVLLAPARRQLKTVEATAAGTDAGPCVEQMLKILERDLKEENNLFQQCLDAPAAQLERLKLDLWRDKDKYTDLKTRTKGALKSCLVNLQSTCPNTTTPCMDTQINYFNINAKNLTDTRLIRGPCMGKFLEALQCFSKSVESYIRKARMVQKKTTACISFEDNDSTRQSILAFAMTLTANTTLMEQVRSAQLKFEMLNKEMVIILGKYYELEKWAKITHEFSPHDKEHFKQKMDVVFAGLLRTVEEVRRSKRHVWPHKKADECCDKALSYIRSTIDNVASEFEKCEGDLLVTTLINIKEVRAVLGDITKDLTHMGDSAIMDCLNNGAILTENAVQDCYDLQLRLFRLNKEDALEKVKKLMTFLERYNSTYFNLSESTNKLCGNSFLKRTEWLVDKILFQLNRCPYKYFTMDEPAIITTDKSYSYSVYNPPTEESFSYTPDPVPRTATSWYYIEYHPTTEYEVTDYPE